MCIPFFVFYTICISFLKAAVTNDQKLDGFKQQKFIFFWTPEVENQGVSRATLPPKALGENPSCLFPLPEIFGIPGLVATSLISASSSKGLLSLVFSVSY